MNSLGRALRWFVALRAATDPRCRTTTDWHVLPILIVVSLGSLAAVFFLARPALGQDYAFSTLARASGFGRNAHLNTPLGVTVDCSGNFFVADTNNHTIRKITAGGVCFP